MSKGERNRIKIRVHSAMASQTLVEGRYLGGRPPHGYRLVDLGPHPNPRQCRHRQASARPGTRPCGRSRRRTDLHRVPARARDLRHRRRPDPRPDPQPLRTRPGPQPAPRHTGLVQERRPRDPHQPPLHRPPGLEPAACVSAQQDSQYGQHGASSAVQQRHDHRDSVPATTDKHRHRCSPAAMALRAPQANRSTRSAISTRREGEGRRHGHQQVRLPRDRCRR